MGKLRSSNTVLPTQRYRPYQKPRTNMVASLVATVSPELIVIVKRCDLNESSAARLATRSDNVSTTMLLINLNKDSGNDHELVLKIKHIPGFCCGRCRFFGIKCEKLGIMFGQMTSRRKRLM